MTILNDIIIQLIQPYFFYSLVFLSIAFIFIKALLKTNANILRIQQSMLWLLPLFIPIAVFICYPPQASITITPSLPMQLANSDIRLLLLGAPILSFSGILCISGIIAATSYLLLTLVFGKRIALKRFQVIMLTKEEYIPLQQEIKDTSKKLCITEPKVGLIDDLMPNAYTIGYGKNAVVVFSLGLLKMLDSEELAAVISHELAHIKAKDYLFRAFTNSLNALSFFNPLSYLAAAHAQKDRELLADEKSIALIEKPKLMQTVLIKLDSFTPKPTKMSIIDRFSSSLFIVSPLAHRPGILATHPQISQRLQNITSITTKQAKKTRTITLNTLLICLLALATFFSGYAMVQFDQTIIQNQNANFLGHQQVLMYNSTITNNPTPESGILFQNQETFHNFTSQQYGIYLSKGT